MSHEITAGENDDGRRLDRLLRKAFPDLPLSLIHRLLRGNRVFVDGKPGRADLRIGAGSVIRMENVEAPRREKDIPGGDAPGGGLLPEEALLWEGKDLLAVNKPKGIAVHGPGALDGMVQNHLRDKLPPSASFRPGPLHRLDQMTSGIVMFSASLRGARFFASLLQTRRIEKRYLALVEGKIQEDQTWEDFLLRDRERRKTVRGNGAGEEGKYAITRAHPLAATGGHTLLLLEIGTGRTHQIRSQAASHGHPLAGDRKYGGAFLSGGLLLHALSLKFPVPLPEESRLCPEAAAELTGKTILAPVPEAFSACLRRLFGDSLPKSCHNPGGFHIIEEGNLQKTGFRKIH